MPSFHHSIAISPLRKFRKNYVSAVRITLLTWKIPLRRCRSHLPLHRNCHSVAIRSNPIFCRSAVGGLFSAVDWRLNFLPGLTAALTNVWLLHDPTITVTCPCSPRTYATLKYIHSSSSPSTNQRSSHFIPMHTERRFQHFRSHLQRQR